MMDITRALCPYCKDFPQHPDMQDGWCGQCDQSNSYPVANQNGRAAGELEAAYAYEAPPTSDYHNTSSDVTPDPTSIEAVRHAFTSYLFVPDTTIVDVTMAAYVANHMPGDPVWLDVIGAPSRGKTEIVTSLADMPDVHMISTLTPQTFASGVRRDRNASLLYRLEDQGKRIVVLKDLTTVLTMNRAARDMVFGALREIYDGRFSKEFGTGESIQWEGKLGLIAGVTPVIDRHHVALAQLGDRRQSACARSSIFVSPSPTTVFGSIRTTRRPHAISGSASTSRRPIPP